MASSLPKEADKPLLSQKPVLFLVKCLTDSLVLAKVGAKCVWLFSLDSHAYQRRKASAFGAGFQLHETVGQTFGMRQHSLLSLKWDHVAIFSKPPGQQGRGRPIGECPSWRSASQPQTQFAGASCSMHLLAAGSAEAHVTRTRPFLGTDSMISQQTCQPPYSDSSSVTSCC